MVAVNYLWNPINDNIVREFDDSGNTLAEYTTEPDLYGNVVSQRRNGQTSYLHFDRLGNTTELTNDGGTVTDTIRYSAFGELTQRTGSTEIPFQYIGRRQYYGNESLPALLIRRRWFSPTNGRWLSPDPRPLADVTTYYLYVLNAPFTFIDPSGLQCAATDTHEFYIPGGAWTTPFETDIATIKGDKCYSGPDPEKDWFPPGLGGPPTTFKNSGVYTIDVVFSSYHWRNPGCNAALESGWRRHDPTVQRPPEMWKIWKWRLKDKHTHGDDCTVNFARFGKDSHGCLTVRFHFACPVKCVDDPTGKSFAVCVPTVSSGKFYIGTTRGGGGLAVVADWTIEYGREQGICCPPCYHATMKLYQTGNEPTLPPDYLPTLPEEPILPPFPRPGIGDDGRIIIV